MADDTNFIASAVIQLLPLLFHLDAARYLDLLSK